MKEIRYDFVELESDNSFEQFKDAFGGTLKLNTLHFDNTIAQGELVKKAPEKGLWIRKWKLTVFKKVLLHRDAAPADHEQKFSLIYFLNPSLFDIKKQLKKIPLNSKCGNLLASNELPMDFSVLPKQPFYVVDITFTAHWLLAQFNDANDSFKELLNQYLQKGAKTFLMTPCLVDEYKTLHELDILLQAGCCDQLSIRARVYNLVCSFFNKAVNQQTKITEKQTSHYDRIIEAEAILMAHLKKAPPIATIAQRVNMSISSLLRQFKLVYGKSLHEYYISKKMEMAKKMIIENGLTVIQVAHILGYKQSSAFIAIFKKHHEYSPGLLKI
jgi:AraC-like DNA-binding protein